MLTIKHVRRNGFWFPVASGNADDLMTHRVLKALFEPLVWDFDARTLERGLRPTLATEWELIDDHTARDTMQITRKGSERLFDFAFDLDLDRRLFEAFGRAVGETAIELHRARVESQGELGPDPLGVQAP